MYLKSNKEVRMSTSSGLSDQISKLSSSLPNSLSSKIKDITGGGLANFLNGGGGGGGGGGLANLIPKELSGGGGGGGLANFLNGGGGGGGLANLIPKELSGGGGVGGLANLIPKELSGGGGVGGLANLIPKELSGGGGVGGLANLIPKELSGGGGVGGLANLIPKDLDVKNLLGNLKDVNVNEVIPRINEVEKLISENIPGGDAWYIKAIFFVIRGIFHIMFPSRKIVFFVLLVTSISLLSLQFYLLYLYFKLNNDIDSNTLLSSVSSPIGTAQIFNYISLFLHTILFLHLIRKGKDGFIRNHFSHFWNINLLVMFCIYTFNSQISSNFSNFMKSPSNISSIVSTTLLPSIQSSIDTQNTIMNLILIITIISWFLICLPDWVLSTFENIPNLMKWFSDYATDLYDTYLDVM